ncbi:hypothetical protein GCM10010299_45130 [Streptomyces tanashiensis]|nr:hypothetical protein GCM10010299_45130 [Streptomyces tanashiensis]
MATSGAPTGPNELAWFEALLRPLAQSGLAAENLVATAMFLSSAVRDLARIATEIVPYGSDYGNLLAEVVQADRQAEDFTTVRHPPLRRTGPLTRGSRNSAGIWPPIPCRLTLRIRREGGERMASGRPQTGGNGDAGDDIHRRWLQLLHRSTGNPSYRDEWFDEQCGGCRFWIALSGDLGLDWGACTHAGSPFDGRVRFEHDGCEHFSVRDDGTFG